MFPKVSSDALLVASFIDKLSGEGLDGQVRGRPLAAPGQRGGRGVAADLRQRGRVGVNGQTRAVEARRGGRRCRGLRLRVSGASRQGEDGGQDQGGQDEMRTTHVVSLRQRVRVDGNAGGGGRRQIGRAHV